MDFASSPNLICALAACTFSVFHSCHADGIAPSPPDAPGPISGAIERIGQIAVEPDWDVLVSGYAHHSRDTYGHKRRARLNEKAWGGGFGKTQRNASGNDESLFAAAIMDSNRNLQFSAGYAHQWIFPLASTGVEAGVGVSAMMIRREDWFDGFPFPAVLPVFSLGTKKIKLASIYVPRVSTRKGKGDVLLLYLKFTL